jgi:subtilisin family serine protease
MKKKILALLFIAVFILSYGSIFSGGFCFTRDASAREYNNSDINKKTDFNKGRELKKNRHKLFSIISPSTLPAGTVGKKYSYYIRASEGFSRASFGLDKKSTLPPGLNLKANGLVSGIPITPGGYLFCVNLKSASDGSIIKQNFTIKILNQTAVNIKVIPRPLAINIFEKRSSVNKITYSFATTRIKKSVHRIKQSASVKPIIHSDYILKSGEGAFRKDGQTLLSVKAPLKVLIKNNTGKTSETLTVPASILKEISKYKASKITYSRIFKSDDNSIKLAAEVIIKKAKRKAQGKDKEKKSLYVKGQIVVVTKDSKAGKNLPEHLSKKYKLKIVESFSVKALKKRITVFKTKEKALKLITLLKREKGVIQAQTNNLFGTMAEPKSDMQNIARQLNFSKLHKSYRGKGVVVAVIDTGVDIKHRDLKDRVIFHKNLLRGSSYKAEIHGTAVAGIIAASINGFGIEGIAPEVQLIALRACRQISAEHPEGRGNTFSILKALDIAIDKKAQIVNMSFGSYAPDRLIREILKEGSKRRMIFVAPVGNVSGLKGPTFPASCPYVIAVGGMDDKGNYYPDKAAVSKARVCAPAQNVFTTIPQNKHNFLSGTSISTAIVSGILAVAVEKNGTVREKQLPVFNNDICGWTEKILQISICRK